MQLAINEYITLLFDICFICFIVLCCYGVLIIPIKQMVKKSHTSPNVPHFINGVLTLIWNQYIIIKAMRMMLPWCSSIITIFSGKTIRIQLNALS